jgi:hypothetical protein
MAKSVVYTCLYGSGEILNEQNFKSSSDVELICFTDQKNLQSETWKVIYQEGSGIGSPREAKKPKILPHQYLDNYICSLYIDNTVKLKQDTSIIIDELKSFKSDFVVIKHPFRSCIYDEAEEVIALDYEFEKRVREQVDFYKNSGYPANQGLIAGTFIFRNHHSCNVKKVCDDWWEHVMRYGVRDQLSFNFVAWKHGYQHLKLDINLCDNQYFSWPIFANRIPRDFNEQDYLWLNPDLNQKINDPFDHYMQHGVQEGRRYKYSVKNQLTRLANKYKSDKGDLCYNKHNYTRVYNDYLLHLKNEAFSLFEIGLLRHDVQASINTSEYHDAPSLKMWSEFFANAEILGFDIQNFSSVENGRIRFCQGDQYSSKDLIRALARISKPLRVIIDDGSHASHHQQLSLSVLFRFLEPGGYYFIEDLHFQPAHLECPSVIKTYDFLKSISNHESIEIERIPTWDIKYLIDSIASINFYDSCDPSGAIATRDALAVIQKKIK